MPSTQTEEVLWKQRLFTPNGRTAFKTALELFDLSSNDVILLPAYVGINDKEGSGVLDPVEAAGVRYEFYEVDKNLAPVLEDLKKKISQPNVKAVLAIHYFGFPASTFEDVVRLCKEHGKILIEDCAHALYSHLGGKRLGTFGDAAFFSLHKFLPVPSGGMLWMHNQVGSSDEALTDTIAPEALAVYESADLEKIREKKRSN